MIEMNALSAKELSDRRRQLRQQRRWRNFQTLWGALSLCSLAGGLAWFITLPGWIIREPDQVTIVGNQLLPSRQIQNRLALTYPHSLLQVQPQQLAQKLQSSIPVSEVRVMRQLFPPRLMIYVHERQPIAIGSLSFSVASDRAIETQNRQQIAQLPEIMFIDRNDQLIPAADYLTIAPDLPFPPLQVLGLDNYNPNQWRDLYQQIQASPVKIIRLDWRNSSNIILHTEMGKIHLGPYSPRLAEQFLAMQRLRSLPRQISPQKIAYINLANPDTPLLQMK